MPGWILFFWLCPFHGKELWFNMPDGYTGFMPVKRMSEYQNI
jgi:hypothetical protein